MTEIIGVRFKDTGKTYFFKPQGHTYRTGEMVIVNTASGIECGVITIKNKRVKDDEVVKPLKPIIRKANEKDLHNLDVIKIREQQAIKICENKIKKYKLDMKIVDAEYSFDMKKVSIYFVAEDRVDFRELVRDLASSLHARIELRQVGVRDQAKILGGIGECGREFCCKSFLKDFHPVSIKMAKQQNLSLNPIKISGCCGRLMCCLKYEQDAYSYLLKKSPKVGDTVITPDGEGKITEINILSGNLKVKFDNANSPSRYNVSDIKSFKRQNKKNKK